MDDTTKRDPTGSTTDTNIFGQGTIDLFTEACH
jgi:hypothetical protein